MEETLRVYRNTLSDGGNWIGFRFREEGQGRSPIGTRVTIQYSDRSATAQIVTGDSHRSQHANTVHFGLGTEKRVNSVEVRWPNGHVITVPNPAINQYHDLRQGREQR